MKILCNPDLCYGCKVCQMICSFHHTGCFWPEKSSITAVRDPQRNRTTLSIAPTCDGCGNETEPLCAKYCTYEAIKVV